MNVSNDNNASQINFTIDGPNSDSASIDGVSDDRYVTYDGFTAGSNNGGDYDITAESSEGESSSIEITIDRKAPVVEKESDQKFVSNNPVLGFTVSDDYSDVVSLSVNGNQGSIEVQDENRDDVCGGGGTCTETFDVTTDDLSNGDTFVIDANAEDEVGHYEEYNFEYTYDDNFEADKPEFSVDGADDDNNVLLSDDVSVDVDVGNMDDETSEVRVSCLVDGDEVDQTDWENDNEFSCDIPEEDVEDETVDVSVEACDEAGNCEDSDEESYTFDSSSPLLDSFSTLEDYKKFGGEFEVEFEASDSASGVQGAEYFFSTAVLPGDGYSVNLDDDQQFTVDTDNLPNSETSQTVYMRVQDGVGQWSNYESVSFEYYPDAKPSVSLTAPENFSVTAGETRIFEVTVENTGKLMINSVNVSVSSDLFTASNTIQDLGTESKTASFEVSPNQSQIGKWTANVETDGPVDSMESSIIVEANSQQRENVQSMLENYTSEVESLESNISSLRSGGLSQELNQSLNENVTPFMDKVETAQQFVEQGKYYKAYSVLENVEQVQESAKQTFSQVKEQDRISERNSMLMMLFAGLVVVAAGAGAFVYSREDFEIDLSEVGLEDYRIPDTGVLGEKVSAIKESAAQKLDEFTEKVEEEEEEVEQKFQGFS